MNLDSIKTKKAMVEFAAKHQVELSSTTLKGMKQEFIQSTEKVQTVDFNELANQVQAVSFISEVIDGNERDITIVKGQFSTKISMQGLEAFCNEHEMRLIDVEKVIDKTWLNVGGYTFSTKGGK